MSKTIRKITPCPIIDTVAELRFSLNDNIHPSMLIGKYSSMFEHLFPEFIPLPIMNIPEEIRLKDPSMRNEHWARISGEKFGLAFGSHSIAIYNEKEYQGWEAYFSLIKKVIDILSESKVIKTVHRIGLRYADKFNSPVLSDINVSLHVAKEVIAGKGVIIKAPLPSVSDLNINLDILNVVDVEIKDKSYNDVSLLSIDVFKKTEISDLKETVDLFNLAHTVQKDKFIKLIGDQFLENNGFTVEWE